MISAISNPRTSFRAEPTLRAIAPIKLQRPSSNRPANNSNCYSLNNPRFSRNIDSMIAHSMPFSKIVSSDNSTDYQFTTVIGIDVSKNIIDVADNQDSVVKTVGNNKELTQWIDSIAERTTTINRRRTFRNSPAPLHGDTIQPRNQSLLSAVAREGKTQESGDPPRQLLRGRSETFTKFRLKFNRH